MVELPAEAVVGSLTENNIRNKDGARGTVQDALSRAGLRGYEIAVVIPDDAARIAFLSAENLPRNPEEQRTFIRWKLKKAVPFDVDTAQAAFRQLGPHDLLVALSPRFVIEEYEDLMQALDLHAGFVIPSTLAALNLYTAPVEDALFLKINPDCVTTTVFQNGRMQFYRRVFDTPLYDAVFPTILYYQDKLGGKAMAQIMVCGYDSDLRSAVAELQDKLGIPAQRLEPKNVDDVFKPALGAVNLSWVSLI